MINGKSSGPFLTVLLLLIISLLVIGCGNDKSSTTDNTGTKVQSTLTPTPTAAVTATVTPEPPTPSAEPTALPTVTEAAPTATPIPDDADAPTPTPVDAEPTKALPTPTPTLRDSTAERDEYWDLTYLIWLPKFTSGNFDSKASDDTFDYASFTDVTDTDVLRYIDLLTESGFTNIYTAEKSDGNIEYIAGNADDWRVHLSFSDGTLTVGSGFEDAEEPDSDEEARKLAWSSTILEYLPMFEDGTYAGFESEEDDSIFCYAFFNDVTESNVRNYIASLQEAGYIYGIDEGDVDGIIWFMALNEDRLSSYVAYDNNIVKIGCGYEE